MEYRHNNQALRWAALFEPGAVDLFESEAEFKAAGEAREVGPIVEQAISIVEARRGPAEQRDREDLSNKALSQLVETLQEHALSSKVVYGSFEHFSRASKDGPLSGSAWVYELPNANPLGRNEPISSGCRTFGPELNKKIQSVCVTGGLILFQEPFCRLLEGQIPLVLVSAAPVVVPDLDVWNRLASSAYTWG